MLHRSNHPPTRVGAGLTRDEANTTSTSGTDWITSAMSSIAGKPGSHRFGACRTIYPLLSFSSPAPVISQAKPMIDNQDEMIILRLR
ncbi:hypothetical protein D3C80_674290 [compost metagenome]